MTNSSNIIQDELGVQNVFAVEPRTYIDPNYENAPKEGEIANGRWAMIGFIAAIGAYSTTGQIMPGMF